MHATDFETDSTRRAAAIGAGARGRNVVALAPRRRIGLVGRIAEGGGRHRGGLPDTQRPTPPESCSTIRCALGRGAAHERWRTLGRSRAA